MILKPVITYKSTVSECLQNVFQVISSMNVNSQRNLILDLSRVDYPSPNFVIPLLTFILHTESEIEIKMSEALHQILFPNGFDVIGIRSLLLRSKLNEYLGKDCLPLIVIPTKSANEDETSMVMSTVENALYAHLNTSSNVINGIRYVIGEIIDNITQHSQSPHSYFFSKVNRESRYIDIGISDMGIGLLGSYMCNHDIDIQSDIEAMHAACRGISTKNLPNAENRGFGIITSQKMIINGLDGFYCMISGNAMMLKTSSLNQYIELSPEIKLKGTIVLFRIPFDEKTFNYINYIE